MQFPGLPRFTPDDFTDPNKAARMLNDVMDQIENSLQKGLDPINNSRTVYFDDIEITVSGNASYDTDSITGAYATDATPENRSKFGREWIQLDLGDMPVSDVVGVQLLRMLEQDGSEAPLTLFKWRYSPDKTGIECKLQFTVGDSSTPSLIVDNWRRKRKMRASILVIGGRDG